MVERLILKRYFVFQITMQPTHCVSLFTLALISLSFSGCIAPPPTKEQPTVAPFEASAYDSYKKPGTGKITGQAFMNTRGGDVKTAAGRKVTLLPATAFMREVRTLKDRGIIPTTLTPDVAEVVNQNSRTTIADVQGGFEFTGLPAGEYMIESTITWQAGNFETGGLVSAYTKIKDGESVRVMVTH